jgi:hypothetical protein
VTQAFLDLLDPEGEMDSEDWMVRHSGLKKINSKIITVSNMHHCNFTFLELYYWFISCSACPGQLTYYRELRWPMYQQYNLYSKNNLHIFTTLVISVGDVGYPGQMGLRGDPGRPPIG